MTAQTRERPTPAGRPFAERISDAPDARHDTSEVPLLRDPQRIAGVAVHKYGPALAHQIACEMASLVDYLEHGSPAKTKRIPHEYRETATAGIAGCRAALAEVVERMTPAPPPRTPPPGGLA